MTNKFDTVIVHYDEIGLKGNNRSTFEKILIENIKNKMKNLAKSIKREEGQITIEISSKNYSKIEDILSKIPGIAYFSFTKKASLDFEKLKKEVIQFVKDIEYTTFKIDTHRHNKRYELKSMEVNALIGEAVIDKYNKKVKMKNPDLMLKVEISDKSSYLSHESIQGVGGLPTDPRQKMVSLISGGFDSPVAAYMMMKRGAQIIFVHFHNKNQSSTALQTKINELVEQLSKFQIKTILYIIPFENIQKQIIMNARAETRMLIYRRFMLRISSRIAELNKSNFLILGDSLSQVASQTLENIEATYKVSDKIILSPVIGLNKKEIIDISRKIGTYDISKQPYEDCCSYFLPKHPVIRADVKELEEIESNFDIKELIDDAIKNAKMKKL